MALPAVLLKAKNAVTKAKTTNDVKNAVKNSESTSGTSFGRVPVLLGGAGFFILLLILVSPLFIVASIATTFQIQAVDPAYADEWSNSGGVDLNYDFEALYSAAQGAGVSPNSPATDLANTTYGGVAGFNEHIKQCVEEAGYGTRAGVVAAGKCLISDYIEATGYRMRYSMPQRGNSGQEGISDNTYFDCSSFGWWALYNGGFNKPSYDATPGQLAWAQSYGIATKDYSQGQPGDYLIYDHGGGAYGHNRLIIGTYDSGFYIAEFTGSGGGVISKTDFSNIESKYYLIQMEKYYSDPSNVR